jgi:tRNA threonylcarbamoyladenosine biosynthesis protein TsaE
MNKGTDTVTFTTKSADETIAAGHKIAGMLRTPLLLLLRGDLGAGKTTLVKGIAEAYGAAEANEVTSPTFTLLHEYLGTRDGEQVLLCHLDLYRVDSERQLAAIGLDEMPQADSIVLVEWGEKFPRLAARSDGEIVVKSLGGDTREITMSLRGTA